MCLIGEAKSWHRTWRALTNPGWICSELHQCIAVLSHCLHARLAKVNGGQGKLTRIVMPYTPPPRRPKPLIFWIIAAIVIAALIVAWIFWANNLGRGANPRTDVPMTPGYAPATSTAAHPAVPADQA